MASSSMRVPALPLLLLTLSSLMASVRPDFASDQAECSSQLISLAACLTYVRGSAKAPTTDCCSGLKQIVAKSFKCLCVLIKDRNEPSLGITINVTLALLLPSTCDAPAHVTDCPRLLNLPPNSSEAKVFEQFGNDVKAHAANGSGNSTGSMVSRGNASGERDKSSLDASGESNKRWLAVTVDAGMWMLSLVLHLLLFN